MFIQVSPWEIICVEYSIATFFKLSLLVNFYFFLCDAAASERVLNNDPCDYFIFRHFFRRPNRNNKSTTATRSHINDIVSDVSYPGYVW